jgi:hypothetical protein
MIGAYLRGRFLSETGAKREIADRYGLESPPAGHGLRFDPERVTWWRGFHLETAPVELPALKKAR